MGTINREHKQIGKILPPPLSFAPGRNLKKAIDVKRQHA
jgi:hypothetical protein